MFFNADMLTKRGPLARVWMASHLSSKVSKQTLLSASIPASVAHIVGDVGVDMALRLSSQLLLGVSRIYQRKAGYLLDDCREVLGRVKKAFRPAAVDLAIDSTTMGATAARDAITLQHEQGGLEDLLNFDAGGGWNTFQYAAPAVPSGSGAPRNVSARADITLPDPGHDWDYGTGGFIDHNADPDALFDLGNAADFEDGLFDMDEVMGRGKKRARNDVDGEEDEMDLEDPSVELGRDAAGSFAHASARGSVGLGLDDDADMLGNGGAADKFDGEGFDLGLENEDLGGMDYVDYNDYGNGGGDDRAATPQRQREPSFDALGLTPKTAAHLAAKATPQKKQADEERAAKRQKVRAQLVDKATELEWQHGARNKDKENLFAEPTFLPPSRLHLRLLEIKSDPSAYYLPRADPTDNKFELAAGPDTCAELASLYRFPTRRQRIAAARREAGHADDEDVELGRRAATPLDGADADLGGMDYVDYNDYGNGGGDLDLNNDDLLGGIDGGNNDETFQFDTTPRKQQQKKANATPSGSAARRQAYLLEELEPVGKSEGPLAVFDESNLSAFSQSQSQSQSHAAGAATHSLDTAEEDDLLAPSTSVKWSKNTSKALAVLSDELTTKDALEFDSVAEKATKRAASAFFFELLVLSTRDCVKLEQRDAFGDITVKAKERLWDNVPSAELATA